MVVLLDTNALLWFFKGDARITDKVRREISRSQRILVSDVTLFEISIKVCIQKLVPMPTLQQRIAQLDATIIHIEPEHLALFEKLPLLHRDPFDRMLIAQAIAEDATLITGDKLLATYDVETIIV